MRLFEYAARVAVRRVVVVLVLAALACLGIGQSRAQDTYPTQMEAYAACKAYESAEASRCSSGEFDHSGHGHGGNSYTSKCTKDTLQRRYYMSAGGCINEVHGTLFGASGSFWWSQGGDCPVGTEPDLESGQCVNPQERCLNKNNDLPSETTAIYTGPKCYDGCEYGTRPGLTGVATTGASSIAYGGLGFTGNTCSGDNGAAPPPPGPTCVAAGDGMTMCIKPGGEHCYSAGGQSRPVSGDMICWSPGETGHKGSNDVGQTRAPGTDPPTPPPPPPGESWNPNETQGPTTSSTNQPNGTTTTTTVINNSTSNGTDATPDDSGEPIDGSGGDDGDDGEGETGSGGEGCDNPPVCSDAGSIGCATLQQVWRTRCSKNGNKVGGGECGPDGSLQAFTCSGDEIGCHQGLLLAQEHCRNQKADANGDGLADVLGFPEGEDGKGDMGSDQGEGETVSLGMGMLDDTGFFGAPTCPTLGVLEFGVFGTFDLDAQPWLCDLTTLVRWTLTLIGAFLAFGIVAGRGD